MVRIHRFLLHVGVICSLVCVMARILDWYNPFMDFGGHITFVQQILYAVPVLLLFTARRI
jgi:hypothetical protein